MIPYRDIACQQRFTLGSVLVTVVESGNGGLAVDDGSDWNYVFFVT